MPKNTSVVISDHFAEFIEKKIGEGRFGSASDVVRAGLRLLEERETALVELRKAIDEGEADIAAGRVHRFENADMLTADIVARGEARSKRRR